MVTDNISSNCDCYHAPAQLFVSCLMSCVPPGAPDPSALLYAGSSVSLTLYFLRFALGINVALCLFWLGGAVIPFMISPPATFSWFYFRVYKPLDLLQGYGLHNTFLLYGKLSGTASKSAFLLSHTSVILLSR